MLKAGKLISIRLVNYHEDGINWKDHKDKVLDFWVQFKSKNDGFNPTSLSVFKYFENLPNPAKEAYENWFNSYDFQNEQDKEYLKWIDGKFNFFYHTSSPTIMNDNTWFVYLTKSEEDALDICESQIFHGNPNIDAFWKVDANTKSDEVGGRRNGYIFSSELESITPKETKDYFWAVAFQAKESVKLFYMDSGKQKSKVISWAADAKNCVLLQITSNGRFIVKQTFVKSKGWKKERHIPQDRVPKNAYLGYALTQYFKKNYYEMFGIWEEIDEEIKSIKEGINQRRNAVNTMNDEEVNISKILKSINKFIQEGNVSRERRERNKLIRKNIKKKTQLREREIRKIVRETKKYLKKKRKKQLQKLSPIYRR